MIIDKIDNFLYLFTLLNIFIYFQIVSIACMMLIAARNMQFGLPTDN